MVNIELNYNSIVSIEVLNGVIKVWDYKDDVTTFNNCDESFWTFIDKIKL